MRYLPILWLLLLGTAILSGQPLQAETKTTNATYSEQEIRDAVEGVFAQASEGTASLVERIFSRYGRPTGYILGSEGGASFFFGLRYGHGVLNMKSGLTREVYWQGPSIGWDIGANAVKSFTLVYNLQDLDNLFQRFPGVDGSVYVVGGLSMNVQRSQDITLVPIRSGVGLRIGANVGYLQYTREKDVVPF